MTRTNGTRVRQITILQSGIMTIPDRRATGIARSKGDSSYAAATQPG